jgi:hypothetical protein
MYKIGLSLLIALAFILPSGTFMAGSIVKQEADDTQFWTGNTEQRMPGLISQQPPCITFCGFQLEDPDEDFFDIVDGTTIPLQEFYIPWLTMCKEDQIPAVVKPHMEIYKLTEGLEVEMYNTSFENNFDIYNNWVQKDGDCGLNESGQGHFDSWTWSDARASDGDYSMKSTMYDIYKGNQDDWLECTIPFNVSDQHAVEVFFDIWVDGDYYDDGGTYLPYDFASFEIGTNFDPLPSEADLWIEDLELGIDRNDEIIEYDFYDTFIPLVSYDWNISGNVTNLGRGWWQVRFKAEKQTLIDMGLNVEDIRFRFDWHTDPQFQYEGAYVDNFKVISIESDREKIYQGHSQGPYDMFHHIEPFEFPLKWYPEEGCYLAILWLEVLDPEHESCFDWPGVEIEFCVGDEIDCEIIDMYIDNSFTGEIVEDDGWMEEGSDAHIVFTYHHNGTVPATDVEVTATATKFEWEKLWDFDFEGSVSPLTDTFGTVHLTDRDAFTGSQSLGFFDPDTFEYPIDVQYQAYGPNVDFTDVVEMYLNVYYKCNTDPGDYLYPGVADPHNGYILGSSYGDANGNRIGGYHPDWIGPTDTCGQYVQTDILDLVNYYRSRGFLQDEDGAIMDIGVGFFFSTDDDEFNTHPDALDDDVYWSGVFIDDLTLTQKKLGDVYYTETIIIPGPLEPCDTYTAQFEWEDVPFSNYEICVEAECEGDIDPDDNKMCQNILVLDYLEHINEKEVESKDHTAECEGEWGICSSDTDNYLATNPSNHHYAANENSIVQLCPDGETPINISGKTLEDLCMKFWYDIETDYDYVYLEVYDGDPPEFNELWQEVANWTGQSEDNASADEDGWIEWCFDLSSFVTGDVFNLRFRLASDPGTEARGFMITWLEINDEIFERDEMDDMDNWCVGCWSLGNFWNEDTFCMDPLPDLFIDNGLIWGTEINDAYEAYLILDHNYTFQNVIEFMLDRSSLAGSQWGTGAATNFTQFAYSGHNYDWDIYFGPGYGNILYWLLWPGGGVCHAGLRTKPLDLTAIPAGLDCTVDMNQNVYAGGPGTTAQIRALSHDTGGSLTGTIVLDDFGDDWGGGYGDEIYSFNPYDLADPDNVTIEAYVNWDYAGSNLWQYFGCDVLGATETATGYLEISIDGGDTWFCLDSFTGDSGGDIIEDPYDLTPWAGNDILIQFRVEGNDDSVDHRFWCINDVFVAGKTDDTAPTSSATMSGTMKESGWYTTGVKVTLTATDVGAGMGEIHYILDGSESVVAGDKAEFTVSGNGEHNIEFWAVDAMGNEETPHNVIPTFRIDMGSAPTVQITAPEPGLYLFGNKLLSASKVIIIGAFTAEATASDAESGIYRVQFYLDGDLISEDTEMPFSAYIAEKHMGAGEIKVIAEDFAQNTAEDTLDITYYKFL